MDESNEDALSKSLFKSPPAINFHTSAQFMFPFNVAFYRTWAKQDRIWDYYKRTGARLRLLCLDLQYIQRPFTDERDHNAGFQQTRTNITGLL